MDRRPTLLAAALLALCAGCASPQRTYVPPPAEWRNRQAPPPPVYLPASDWGKRLPRIYCARTCVAGPTFDRPLIYSHPHRDEGHHDDRDD